MADRYLLESGTPDGYLLEDGTGVLLIEPPPTYYIDPSGNDSTGDGSIGNPWQNLSKAYAMATVPGTTVYCRGGTYAGEAGDLIVDTEGLAGLPITVAAYPTETPVFDYTSAGTYVHPIWFRYAKYHVVDGLQFTGAQPTAAAVIVFGAGDGHTNCSYIKVVRVKMTLRNGLTANEHGFYLSSYSDHITIGGSEAEKVEVHGSNEAAQGAAIELYHDPASTNFLIDHVLVDGVHGGIQIWDSAATPTATGTITHCTVTNSHNQYDMRFHSTLLLRDNVGGSVINLGIYDPNNSASTTSDHNYTGETLSASPVFGLTAGSSAINGANDGSDAGWADYSSGSIFTVPTASLTLSPFAPTLVLPRVMTPGVASLTLSPFAPTLVLPRVMTPGVASLTLSPFAPTLVLPRVMTPGVASLTLSPFAPTLVLPRVMTPGVASLTLSPFAPTLVMPISVTPGVASLVTSMLTPTWSTTAGGVTFTVPTASLTLSPFAPTLVLPRVMTPGVASMTLSPFAPTLVLPRVMTPGVASLTLSPFAPTLVLPRVMTPGVAALTLSPFAPTLVLPRVMTPGVASLTLSPFAPTLVLPRVMTPGVASLTLSPFAPTWSSAAPSVPILVTPGLATLVLSPFSPFVFVAFDDDDTEVLFLFAAIC